MARAKSSGTGSIAFDRRKPDERAGRRLFGRSSFRDAASAVVELRIQAWALERVSYSHTHIDDRLLDACVAASEGEPHRQAVEFNEGEFRQSVRAEHQPHQGAALGTCRNAGLPVPAQIVWASHDPATTREAGFVLFDVISAKQKAAQMHVINRTGSLPFREQAAAFHHIVASFGEGVRQEKAHMAA